MARKLESDMAKPIVIVGAGGHGREVAEIVIHAHRLGSGPPLVGFLDQAATDLRGGPGGVEILGDMSWLVPRTEEVEVVIAIGDNRIRKRVVGECLALGVGFARALSPLAHFSPGSSLGVGAMVFPGVVVSLNTRIGDHVILGTHCGVSHDSVVGDFGFLCPGARITGGVTLGEGVMLGANSCVIPGKTVGDWTVVGAGGVVNRDLPDGVTAVGVPARRLPR